MKFRHVSVLALSLALAVSAVAQEPAKSAAQEIVSDPALRAELLTILEADQQDRLKLESLARVHGYNSPEVQALWPVMREKDAANLTKIAAILDARGWVGPEVVGQKASGALFLVIQHSDTAAQKKYLPLLRDAVRDIKAPAANLALMEDRVALAEGRPQTYGSQLRQNGNDSRLFVSPLADPDHVDERRAAIGLPPMAEYLKHWKLTWDVEAYKRELPELEKLQWGDTPRPAGN